RASAAPAFFVEVAPGARSRGEPMRNWYSWEGLCGGVSGVAQARGESMARVNPAMAAREVKAGPPSAAPPLLPLAPRLMLVFWALLGAVAGINLAEGVWRLAGLRAGAVTVAVPIGAVVGAVGGGLVGLITGSRLLVL